MKEYRYNACLQCAYKRFTGVFEGFAVFDWMDGWMEGCMYVCIDGWINGWMDALQQFGWSLVCECMIKKRSSGECSEPVKSEEDQTNI